jgi:RNA polymerase sigma-70 factor (ECF subfamily)
VDLAAIDRLYRSQGHLVLRRARRLLGNEQDALEVLQQVFISLIDRADQLRGGAAPTTWLYAATTHACLNFLRNARTRTRLLADGPRAAPHSELSPESSSILRDLLARVPDDLVQIAVYYYADEMTHAEIASVLGCSRRHVGDLVERLHALVRVIEQPA